MRTIVFAFCVGMLAVAGCQTQVEPYKNPELSPEERAEDLLGRLTLEEKISLMQNSSPGVERLGIKPYDWWNEALHGVARAGLATVYPITMGMASMFDDEAVERVYTTVSDEARAKFHDARRNGRYGRRYEGLTFWTPNVNIFRDPRWGRGQETWGEDPYLTSRMGVAVVRGLQGPADAPYDKLHACAKHFAVHSGPESTRHFFDVEDLDPRDLWETYLPAFKALVQEADVKEVMCAYQRFEGEPCCGSDRLLAQILREEWGYKHLVVSDCGAISDFFRKGHHETHPDAASASAAAVDRGTDLECGGEYAHLGEAVQAGLITEERIDTSLRRLLQARFALGEMDDDALVSWSRIGIDTVDCDLHRQMALDVARKSMVLLHNRGVLPLDKGAAGTIAVMGPNAADSVMQWGNYEGTPSHTYTILDGIRGKVGQVIYEKGCDLVDDQVLESYYHCLSNGGQRGLKGTYWNNLRMEGDVAAVQQLPTPVNLNNGGNTAFAPGVNLENFTAVYEGTFRPEKGGDYTIAVEGDDGYRVYVDGEKVIDHWGQHASEKRECVLKAQAGKAYGLKVEYMQAGQGAVLKFDIGIRRRISPAEVAGRVKDAATVVFVGGISPRLEGEEMNHVRYPGFAGGDRTTIELPQVQRDVLKALKAAGKKVVLVDCGVKANIIRCLINRGVEVIRVPWNYDYTDMDFDGLFLANGPGDPDMCEDAVNIIRKQISQSRKPICGICMGNQLLSKAAGATIYKLKYGHRSHNQPVRMVGTNNCYITSQNHGYAVDAKTLGNDWEELFVNMNDGSNEGIRHKVNPWFSSQFHPEACSGPVDTEFMFDKFVETLK